MPHNAYVYGLIFNEQIKLKKMITIKEEKIAELMFDIWHKSNDLKNPVMVGEYIAEELTKVKNLAIHDVVKQSELFMCECGESTIYQTKSSDMKWCNKCGKVHT